MFFKEKFLNKIKENTWENFLRMIEKYLFCIEDIDKIKLEELKDIYAIETEIEHKKSNESNKFIMTSMNYFLNTIHEDRRIINQYNDILPKIINSFNIILDKLENKVLELLIVCDKNKSLINNKKFEEKFDKLLIKSYKLFSNLIFIYFNLIILGDKEILFIEFNKRIEFLWEDIVKDNFSLSIKSKIKFY